MNGLLRGLIVWAVLLASWETAYRVIGWRSWVFPAPSHVLDAMLGMLDVRTGFGDPLHAGWPRSKSQTPVQVSALFSSPLVHAPLVSLVRLAAGFGLSVVLGGVLGLAMWRLKWLDQLLGPLFLGLQTLPSVCWAPLATLIFGLNEQGILFVTVMGSFFAIAIALRDGLHMIPPMYQWAGRMMGAQGWSMYRYVLLPASLPALAGSLRQGFSFAWRSLMGAELILALQRRGLGFLLAMGRDFSDVAQVVAVMTVMVAIGMAADRWLFARVHERVQRRFGLA